MLELPAPVAWLVGIAIVLIAIAALWAAAESHYRSCVDAAEARFPGVPVSAFARDPSEVGPVKLSFVEQRASAVEGCSRIPF